MLTIQKIIGIFLAFLSISLLANEVNPNYNFKETERMILDNSLKGYPAVIGHDSTSFYVLKRLYVEFMESYNTDMELLKESDFLKVDYKLKDRHFNQVVYFQDSLYIFYSEYKFLKTYLYVKTIDKYTLEQTSNERLVAEIPHFKTNYPEIIFKLSLLHDKLLIVFRTDAYIQKTVKFDFMVFDKGMELVWEKTDFFEYNHHPPRETTYTVDEDGNVHILSLIYEIKLLNHLLTDDALKNEYLVVSYVDKGGTVVENRLSLAENFIRGIKLIAGENGSYICSGFYSSIYRYGIRGTFFVTNNTPTRQNAPVLYNEFTIDFFDQIPEGNKSARTEEIYSYKIRELVLRENGNIVLCGEQVYEQNYDNVNDIIIVAFNNYGHMLWNRTIPKIQSGNEYNSFCVVAPVTENDVCILYNEHYKNPMDYENKEFKRKSFHYSSPSYLVLNRIDEFGNITREKIMSRTKKELIPDPTKTYDLRNGEIIMFESRYRKYKYFWLTLF